MPYPGGQRLTSTETASKLGHLEIVKSPFVKSLIDEFEYPPVPEDQAGPDIWQQFRPEGISPLTIVIAVDGSFQVIRSDGYPSRSLAFVKTALVRLDRRQMEKIDKDVPHPVLMKALMADSALQLATALPLRNIKVPGLSNYHLVRRIIDDSLQLQAGGIAYETLKWLAYHKWRPELASPSPDFRCPHCPADIPGLPNDADQGTCASCGNVVLLTDMLGFHLDMGEDQAPDSVVTAYMLVHETLLLFSVVRHFWERRDFSSLSNILLIKDGPLTLRGQYSKLVPAIRDLLQHARDTERPIHLIGQEKTGRFADHLAEIERFANPLTRDDPPSFAILSHGYIRKEVDHGPERANAYGIRTNYGEKVLVKLDPHTCMVLSVPTGSYHDADDFPSAVEDLIGFDRILATLPSILSYQHEGALMPISLANGVASLSSYPSATVLKLFAGL